MNTPVRTHSIRSALVMSGLALVTASYLALPAYAADAPATPPAPVPNVTIVDVTKGDSRNIPQAPATTASSSNNNSKGGSNGRTSGNGGSGNTSSRSLITAKGDTTYVIKLRNGSKFAAKGVTVEYHFYNRTTNTNNGVSTYTIEDIPGNENVDIDPGKLYELTTQPISHSNSVSQSGGATQGGGGGRGKGATSSPTQSSTITAVLGWHIELKFNDKVIKKLDSPDNLQDLLKKYNQ